MSDKKRQCRQCQESATAFLQDPANDKWTGYICDLHLTQRLHELSDTDLIPQVVRLSDLKPHHLEALDKATEGNADG